MQGENAATGCAGWAVMQLTSGEAEIKLPCWLSGGPAVSGAASGESWGHRRYSHGVTGAGQARWKCRWLIPSAGCRIKGSGRRGRMGDAAI
jgi:hypothetical protein